MSTANEILDTISKVKLDGNSLTKDDIMAILKATKAVSRNKKMIDSLILFQSTFIQNNNIKILTTRENQVLKLIGIGKTSKIISHDLNLSLSTIETHRKNIRKKLGLVGKGKLVRFAILCNLNNCNK